MKLLCFLILFSLSIKAKVRLVTVQNSINKQFHNKVPKIKVRIAQFLSNPVVSGVDLIRLNHSIDDKKNYEGRKKIRFNCRKLLLKNKKPMRLASLRSPTQFISLNSKKYQGNIHLITSVKRGRCDIVNETNLEYYINTLLSKEMNNKWPLEALKAQSVAARTYAIHKIFSRQVSRQFGYNAFYDIENSEKHQVSGNFSDINQNTINAAKKTKGYVLVNKKNNITPAFFHAKCGGKTMRPDKVWTNPVRGYVSVKCPFCRDHGKVGWRKKLSIKRVFSFLNWAKENKYFSFYKKIVKSDQVFFVPDNAFKNEVRFYLNDQLKKIPKSLFRRYFGRVEIVSNYFTLKKQGNHFVFSGSGRGHGVGMCQLGALDLAQRGWSYRKILSYYFPNHKLVKLY